MSTSPSGPASEPDESAMDRVGPWVALIAAIGLTASGEYELAQMVGFPGWIAWALPTAIDIYVVQAMRRHRDVAAALILMIATNGLLHLAKAHLVGVTRTIGGPGRDVVYDTQWWLIVLVAAIAPVIVWRVHRIREDDAGAATEPPADPVPVSVTPPAGDSASAGPDAAANSGTPAPPEPPVLAAEAADSTPTTGGDSFPAPGDNGERQNGSAIGDSPVVKPPAKKTVRRRTAARAAAPPKAPRRSLGEWVEIAGPIFHDEFRRLRRQPTANEFATAIEAAGLGRPSDSTAKNIRGEILDRTELPALD